MAQRTFTTTDTGKEYPARFGGMVFTYEVPDAVRGDLDATLDALRAIVHPEADFATVLVQRVNGQGYDLEVQKRIKAFLGKEEGEKNAKMSVWRDKSVEEVYEAARAFVASDECRLLREPPVAGEGTGGKTAKLAAERDAAKQEAQAFADSVKMTYLMVPAAHRRTIRKQLLEKGAPFTEELLASWDAEVA